MSECVCGFDPPGDPNPDCERCGLIVELARLRAERDAAIELYRTNSRTYSLYGPDEGRRRVAEAVRLALAPAPPAEGAADAE